MGVDSQGWSLEAGYLVTPNLQPVVRVEGYNPSVASAPLATAETVGVNYWFRDAYTKVQLAGSAMQGMAASNGSSAYVQGAINQDVTLVLQSSI